MEVKDMRDAFFDGVYDAIEKDKNAIILTADHGAFRLNEIARDFPKQYLNVGISEQNMISFAAGLSQIGKTVYVYSINNFISLRSLEHVNVDLCGMKCNVNLIGVGAGFTYSTDGPTHQGMQDVQAMMTLPNLQVFNVTDDINSRKLADLAHSTAGPKYFRIEKGKNNRIYSEDEEFHDGMNKLIDVYSCRNVLISSGRMVHTALKVAEKVRGMSVIDIYRLKPLNEKKLMNLLSGIDNVVTLEENTIAGGLGEKIGFYLAKNGLNMRFLPIAVADETCYYYGKREDLHKKYNIDEDSVYKKIINFLENK